MFPSSFNILDLLLLLSRFSCFQLCATHRRQPTRLLSPWDSPGKSTGMGCHFLILDLQCFLISRIQLKELVIEWNMKEEHDFHDMEVSGNLLGSWVMLRCFPDSIIDLLIPNMLKFVVLIHLFAYHDNHDCPHILLFNINFPFLFSSALLQFLGRPEIYFCLFILIVMGLHCFAWAFSICGEWGLFSICDVWALYCGLSCRGAWVLGCKGLSSCGNGLSSCGSWPQEHGLKRCCAWALSLRGMWDLPDQGLKFCLLNC